MQTRWIFALITLFVAAARMSVPAEAQHSISTANTIIDASVAPFEAAVVEPQPSGPAELCSIPGVTGRNGTNVPHTVAVGTTIQASATSDLQNLIGSLPSGGILKLPCGTWSYTPASGGHGLEIINKSSFTLEGSGKCTVFDMPTVTGSGVQYLLYVSGSDNVVVRGMTFHGHATDVGHLDNGTTVGLSGNAQQQMLFVGSSNNPTIEWNTFEGADATHGMNTAVVANGAIDHSISGGSIRYNTVRQLLGGWGASTGYGFLIGFNERIEIAHNWGYALPGSGPFSGLNQGRHFVYFTCTNHSTIADNDFDATTFGLHPINLFCGYDAALGYSVSHNVISGNRIRGSDSPNNNIAMINIYSAQNTPGVPPSPATHNLIIGNTMREGIGSGCVDIVGDEVGQVNDNVVAINTCTGVGREGFYVYAGSRNKIIGNTATNVGQQALAMYNGLQVFSGAGMTTDANVFEDNSVSCPTCYSSFNIGGGVNPPTNTVAKVNILDATNAALGRDLLDYGVATQRLGNVLSGQMEAITAFHSSVTFDPSTYIKWSSLKHQQIGCQSSAANACLIHNDGDLILGNYSTMTSLSGYYDYGAGKEGAFALSLSTPALLLGRYGNLGASTYPNGHLYIGGASSGSNAVNIYPLPLTANRSQQLPDQGGTFAMMSDIPSSSSTTYSLWQPYANASASVGNVSYQTLKPVAPITVNQIDFYNVTPGVGCSTWTTWNLVDPAHSNTPYAGTGITLSSASDYSLTGLSVNVSTGQQLRFMAQTAPVGCSTQASGFYFTVQYRMQ